MNTTTITLIGDWHGNSAQARRVLTHPAPAPAPAARLFLHLGDFGIWSPHSDSTPAYLRAIQKALEKHTPQPSTPNLFFIDGNHENFPYLYSFPLVPSPYDTPTTPQPYVRQMLPYAPNVYHLPRGTVHNFGTPLNFLAFGGAYSIDRAHRNPPPPENPNPKKNKPSFWYEEVPSLREFQRALYAAPSPSNPNQKIDIMLTHDTPILPPHVQQRRLLDRQHAFRFFGKEHVTQSDAFGPSMLLPLLHHHAPSFLFYGHNHERLYSRYEHPDTHNVTELIGLDEGSAPSLKNHIQHMQINSNGETRFL